MEIRLKQQDVETAVKAHLERMGFDRPVSNMTFIAGRGGNKGLTVEIEVTDPFTDDEPAPTGPVNRGFEQPTTAKAEPKTKATKPKATKAKAEPAPPPEPEAEAEAPVSEDDVQPDQDDDGGTPVDGEPPFATTAEAANEPVSKAADKGKSLFG